MARTSALALVALIGLVASCAAFGPALSPAFHMGSNSLLTRAGPSGIYNAATPLSSLRMASGASDGKAAKLRTIVGKVVFS